MGLLRRSFTLVKCTTVVDGSRLRADAATHHTNDDGLVVIIHDEVINFVQTSNLIEAAVDCSSERQRLGCGRCTMGIDCCPGRVRDCESNKRSDCDDRYEEWRDRTLVESLANTTVGKLTVTAFNTVKTVHGSSC